MEEKICYGCMRKKTEDGICPYCGCGEDIQNEEHQLPVGTVLKEQYLIGRVLGQGGFGITYIGWDRYLDIRVAVKEYYPVGVVSRSSHASTDVVSGSGEIGVRFRNNKERFLREAKMLARLSDIPEIVQVKTFFLANNTAYIVMEYVQGTTLKEYVQQQGGRLSVEESLRLLAPVMRALEKVHRAGVIHRDISPENIMIQKNGRVKLLDFGAVRDVGEMVPGKPLDRSTEAILKQGYAPVEQYQSRGSLGAWTDVYAMCSTLYYCLTGQVPSDAPGRLLGEEIQWPSELGVEIDPGLEEVLKKGMAIMTSERIQSMDELCDQLGAGSLTEAGRSAGSGDNDLGTGENGSRQKMKIIGTGGDIPGTDAGKTEDSGSGRNGADTENADTDTGRNGIHTGSMDSRNDGSEEDEEKKTDSSESALGLFSGENGGRNKWIAAIAALAVIMAGSGVWSYVQKRPETPETEIVSETEGTDAAKGADKDVSGTEANTAGTDAAQGQNAAEAESDEAGGADASPDENTDGQDAEMNKNAEAQQEEAGGHIRYFGESKLSGQCGDHVFYELDKESGVMTLTADEPGSAMWCYELAEEDRQWEEYRVFIRKLVITENVETIGAFAFFDCVNLSEVEGWEYVKQIGRDAFNGTALRELVFPEGLVTIDRLAFYNCPAEVIDIPASVQHLSSNALEVNPDHTEKVTFHGNPYISDYDGRMLALRDPDDRFTVYGLADSNVESWCEVYGSPFESIGELPEQTYSGACGDEVQWSFDPEEGVLTLEGSGSTWDFRGTLGERSQAEHEWPGWHVYGNEIQRIIVGSGITRLGDSLFADCSSAYAMEGGTEAELGEEVFARTVLSLAGEGNPEGKELLSGQCGEHMYYELNPESGVLVLTADEPGSAMWPFDEERGYPSWYSVRAVIRKVQITENVETIGAFAFNECVNLSEVEGWESIRQIGEEAFFRTALKELILSEGVETIGNGAFCLCNSLERVELPESLLHVGESAIAGELPGLNEITVKGNPYLVREEGGALPWKTIKGISGSNTEQYCIEYGMPFESIGELPEQTYSGQCGDSVSWTFDPGEGVLTLSGEGSTWDYRGEEYMENAQHEWPGWHSYSLQIGKIVVEPGITRLGSSLFAFCSNAYAIECSPEVELGDHVFDYTGLNLAADAAGEAALSGQCGDHVYYELNKETGELVLTADAAGSGTWDFTEDTEAPWYEDRIFIRKLTVTENVDAIGEYAFGECVNLREIEGWESLRQIRKCAFTASGLQKLVIPEGLETIGNEAFSQCFGLREAELPASLIYIGDWAFGGDNSLEKMTLKGNARLIDMNAMVLPSPRDAQYTCYGLSGSNLEEYCNNNGLKFESIGELPERILSGSCGDEVQWSFDPEEGVLTLDGRGSTWDYRGTLAAAGTGYEWPQWYMYTADVRKIVIGSGVTRLGNNLFADCHNAYAVECSPEVELGEGVFAGTMLSL